VEEVRITFVFKLNLVEDESQITGKTFFNSSKTTYLEIRQHFAKNVDDL